MKYLKKEFRKWQKDHFNFITPKIIKLEQIKNFIIEISEGRGINNNIIYGVTTREYKDGTFKENDEVEKRISSEMVNDYQEALIKTDAIKRVLKEVTNKF